MAEESWRDGNVAERNFYLLNSQFMTDCTFLVGITEKKEFQCHKFVLSQGSPVFYVMFNGELQEKADVKVEDIEPKHFRKLLEHIYSDNTFLENAETALSVCYAANKYMVNTGSEMHRLYQTLNPDVVCRALEFAHLIDNGELMAKALQYLQLHISEVLKSASFPNVEKWTLLTILHDDDLFISKISAVDVFSACVRWATARRQSGTDGSLREVLGPDVLSLIKFLSMTPHEFATVVIPSKLLEAHEESDILCNIITGTGNIPEGFNISIESRPIYGPRETIELEGYHGFALTGTGLNHYPFHMSFNTDVFLFGLQLNGLELECNGFVKDNLEVELWLDSKLLASAKFDGLIYARTYVEVNFNEAILLKAKTNYTLQTIYRNVNLRSIATQLLDTVYRTAAAVELIVDYNYTTISKIYIAKKLPK